MAKKTLDEKINNIKNNKGNFSVPSLKIVNSGTGNAAFSMISFSNKNMSELQLKTDFASLNGNIIPKSTANVILSDKRVYSYFKSNPSFVYVVNKKTLLIEKIELSKN